MPWQHCVGPKPCGGCTTGDGRAFVQNGGACAGAAGASGCAAQPRSDRTKNMWRPARTIRALRASERVPRKTWWRAPRRMHVLDDRRAAGLVGCGRRAPPSRCPPPVRRAACLLQPHTDPCFDLGLSSAATLAGTVSSCCWLPIGDMCSVCCTIFLCANASRGLLCFLNTSSPGAHQFTRERNHRGCPPRKPNTAMAMVIGGISAWPATATAPAHESPSVCLSCQWASMYWTPPAMG
mmetsp:Transcript_29846/g.84057  ORF Transcript_29846/g.84057 Transcript_29846/m.84057 type:complete len:237 (-) Transcript_29846:299-1009(-)